MDEKKSINLNKIFYIFLALHVILWSLLPLLRAIMPIDAMECIFWGGLMDFGTNKHPPLAGWLAYFVYNLFGKTDYSIYLLGQSFILIGFIYLYKLGKIFLGEQKSILAVMLMEACFVYTYMGIYDGFNPNFLLLGFLPFLSYYFYQCIHRNSLKDWVILGVGYGLSFIGKYQTVMLFLPMLLYLLITPIGREQFKRKGLYIAGVLAFLCVLPHLIWLINNDFFPLNYFALSEERYSGFYHGWIKYLESPFLFLINQFAAVAGVLFVYFTANLVAKQPIKLNKGSKDGLFLICIGIIPLVLQTLPGMINGAYMIPQWGYDLLFMSSILLFYFFPFDISDKVIKYILSWVFAAMIITFIVLGIVFTTEKNFANRFPVKQVTDKLTDIYYKETGKPMKYLGGFIELTIPLNLYNNDYTVILDTYKHKNPWLDEKELKQTGAIVIGRNYELMDGYIDRAVPYLKDKAEIKDFSFTVKSVVGKERVYNIHYAIIPPVSY